MTDPYTTIMHSAERSIVNASAKADGAKRLAARREMMRVDARQAYNRAKRLTASNRTRVLNDYRRIRSDIKDYTSYKRGRTDMRAIVREEKAKVRAAGKVIVGKAYAEIEEIAKVGVAIIGIRVFNAD